MNTYQWLLALHVTGAFLLVGGGAIAAALNLAALSRERPSEIVLLFGLIRIAVVAIVVGSVLAFVFGLWLVSEAPWNYSFSDGWVVAAIVLLILGNAMGGIGGKRDEQTAKLARELAAAGDAHEPRAAQPSPRSHLPRAELREWADPDRAARAHGLEAGRVMLAAVRPDSWNLPLFLHILGAMVLFGSTATVAIAGFASRGRENYGEVLRRVTSRTFLLGVIPAWILMRIGAQWIVGKEFPGDTKTPGWVDVGFIVSEPGALLLDRDRDPAPRSPAARPARGACARRDLRRRPRRRVVRHVGQALERPRAAEVSSSSQSAVSWASPAAERGETAVHPYTLENG